MGALLKKAARPTCQAGRLSFARMLAEEDLALALVALVAVAVALQCKECPGTGGAVRRCSFGQKESDSCVSRGEKHD